jgi:hypothetical protein
MNRCNFDGMTLTSDDEARMAISPHLHRPVMDLAPSHADARMRRVLMVAYHFPPLAGSSGIQRTLRFVQQLPARGWQPLVLTVHPLAYEHTSQDLMAQVPADTVVRRAFALDTARHLQLGGRYAAWMARPDRWCSWQLAAVHEGLRLIRQFKPEVIWSTYPIATAHRIAASLQRQSGLPWVADFRDPMAQDGYPADPRTHASFLAIEAQAAAQARICTFTSPSAAALYRQRYPHSESRMVLLENGYDEETFAAAQASVPRADPTRPAKSAPGPSAQMTLLHSGIVYPSERDPSALFSALASLHQQGLLTPADVRLRFRAPVHEAHLRELAQRYAVQDFMDLEPALPYREALAEMLAADALLVLQASNCNAQIPAKLYEYLRAGPPILGLTDLQGDTAQVLRQAGLNTLAPLDDAQAIAQALLAFLQSWRAGRVALPEATFVQQASRQARTDELVAYLAQAASRAVGRHLPVANTSAFSR